MKSTKILALLLVVIMCVSMFASCGLIGGKPNDGNQGGNNDGGNGDGGNNNDGGPNGDGGEDNTPKTYTYNTYVTISPSNWNELTYQDNNDTEVLGWIQSSFFGFDFKYDENGEIVPGEYEIVYNAATALEDVSGSVDEKWQIPEGAKNLAWKITLRHDLKWENGDPIKAEDFVYSMKEQLNPLFQNYRADSYYNSAQSLIGAKNYAKQGQSGIFAATTVYSVYSEDIDSQLIFTLSPANKTYLEEPMVRTLMGFPASYSAAAAGAYIVGNYITPNPGPEYSTDLGITEEEYNAAKAAYDGWINALAAMEGKTFAEIKADENLAGYWTNLLKWWQTEPNEELHFFVAHGEYGEFSFDDVGIFVDPADEYSIIIVLEKALDLLKEDGTLGYKAAYNMSSLPLVHKATYEANKVAPGENETLWTSTYNSSVETTMSWGPYKLTSFQTGMQFVLDRNENWYGYGLEENEGLYQTDKIVYDVVKDWNSAWILFQAGKLDGIGIDVSIAEDYKNSEQAFFTPSDFVGSLQLQSSKEALAARQEDGYNKTILSYTDFRKAISLSIDRADYTQKCTTSSKAGFGLFNSMHYYDVANGGVFRNTDEAKKVLCEIYAVDYTDTTMYPTLDDAVDAISGYNLVEAAKLYTSAYEAALAAGDIKETDIVKLTFGTGAVNDVVQRRFDYLANSLKKAVEGTPLAGRIELELKDYGDAWAEDFRAGAYDICMGGWTGAAWDPGYFLLAYLDAAYMYSSAWDTGAVEMTFTMKNVPVGVDEDGNVVYGDITETMSLLEWYDALNGYHEVYDWSSAALHESQRLQLIAALEKEVLKVYYTVPLENSFSASLISYQCDYVTYEYNTFMGYGGVKYMTYNFDDAAWTAEVAKQGNQLDYR